MATARRFTHEPALVLHRYDWSESSLILEVFTRQHGRVALVAKGAKKPSSNFRPVLLPLQPLSLTWTQSSATGANANDIHTLKGAEWVGGHIMPTGDALLAGIYLNELLLRLLAREDPHPVLFDTYRGVVRVLASAHGEALEPVLRAFELLLLQSLGLLPTLHAQTLTFQPLQANARYALTADAGLYATGPRERASLSGAQWQALQQAIDSAQPFNALLHACAPTPVAAGLKPQLRALLQYHCGSPLLRTRQLMMELQNL